MCSLTILEVMSRVGTLFCALLLASNGLAETVRVRGKLQDMEGLPVLAGTVRLRDWSQVLSGQFPIVVGMFDIRADVKRKSITLLIDALDFHPRIVTLDVTGPDLQLEPLKLQALPGLQLGAMVHHRVPGRTDELIDVLVRNEKPVDDAQVATIRLYGAKRKRTQCLDLRPGATFRFPEAFRLARDSTGLVALEVRSSESTEVQELSASGRVEVLGCEQVRMELSINYDFVLKARQVERLRIAVPGYVDAEGVAQALGLGKWDVLVLEVTEQDGRKTRTSELKADE